MKPKENGRAKADARGFLTMKTIFKVALATLTIAGTSGLAHADLNYNGEVGLPINPTAQVPQQGGVRLQGNYYDLGSSTNFYSVGVAVRPSAKAPFEINGAVNYLDANGVSSGSKTRFSVGAKYLFTRETDKLGVRLAAGVGYSEVTTLQNTRGYLVASKSFGNATNETNPSIIGHLGVRYDHYQVKGFSGSTNRASVFAGAEVPLTRTGEVQAVGEFGTKTIKGGSAPYSLGLRYRAAEQPFGATVGIQRSGFAGNDGRIFVQVGYTFGK